MRGNKRRAAVVVTAANKPQPALNDAILDVVNHKGMRCCVECGATSTPQWREGPMGPKTLCNACGVRRQRLLRKQQAATVGSVPTAPVAAVQARRRMAARSALQAPMADSDELPYGAIWGSDHSSDETEVHWATTTTTTTPTKRHPRQPLPLLQRQQLQLQTDMEESCNEDENAAYDLLFFAGVECGAGGGMMVGAALDEEEPAGWRSDFQHPQLHQEHGHNTRRHVQPVHRSEDFYYYDEEAAGFGSGGGEGGCKRRAAGAAPRSHPQSRPRTQFPPWLVGSSFPSIEDQDVAESELAPHGSVQRHHKLSDNSLMQQLQQQRRNPEPPAGELRQLPTTHWAADGNTPAPQTFISATGNAPALSAAAVAATTAAAAVHCASAAASTYPPSPPPTHLPGALPVLPLSLSLPPLPAVSARDYEILVKLQLDFQRSCMQLHQANVQCEAVGAVVAEHREAAVSAHQQATAASQQLATEARAVSERYQLRDLLSELHSATSAVGSTAQGLAATAQIRRTANVSEDQQE